MIKLTVKCIHWLWRLLVAITVVVAIAVSVMHFLVKQLNYQPSYLEQQIYQRSGIKVNIDQVSVQWHGIMPVIELGNVTVYRPSFLGHQSSTWLHIKRVKLGWNLWMALLHLSWKPTHVELNGSELLLQQGQQGHIDVNGIVFDSRDGEDPKNPLTEKFIAWLQQTDSAYLNNILIHWQDQQQQQTSVMLKHAQLSNFWRWHHLSFNFERPRAQVHLATVVLSARGNFNNLPDLNARLYLSVNHLSLSQWLHHAIGNFSVAQGIVNGQWWLRWKDGRWRSAQANADITSLVLQSKDHLTRLPIENINGVFVWRFLANGWQFSSPKLLLTVNHHAWPATYLAFERRRINSNAWQQLRVGYLDLSDATAVLTASRLSSKKLIQGLEQMQPTGIARHIVLVHYGDFDHLSDRDSVEINLRHVSWRSYDKIPGLTNINGYLNVQPKSGQLNFSGQQVTFSLPSWFARSVYFYHLSAAASWRRVNDNANDRNDGQDWQIALNRFTAANQDLTINSRGRILLASDHSPIASMLWQLNESNAKYIHKYLPKNHLRPAVYQWLNQAFLGSDPLSATVILYGTLNQFPYSQTDGQISDQTSENQQNKNGIFWIGAKGRHLQLKYGDDWPVLNNLAGTVIFANNRLSATASSGSVYDGQLDQAEVLIPMVWGAKDGEHLYANINAHGDASDGLKFIANSPLQQRLGEPLSLMKIDANNAKLKLKLDVPLSDPDQTKVQGETIFDDASLQLPQWDLSFDQLHGNLLFTEDSLSSDTIDGRWFNYPFRARIATTDQSHGQEISIIAHSKLPIKAIRHYLNFPDHHYVSGTSDCLATVNFYVDQHDQRQHTLNVHSDLQGVSVDFPGRLGKKENEKKSADLTLKFGQDQNTSLLFNYGKMLSIASLFHQHDDHTVLYSTDLRFNDGDASIQSLPGLKVSGHVDYFNWRDWKRYVNDLDNNSEEINDQSLMPRFVDLTFNRLVLLDQPFSDVEVKAMPEDNHFNIDINGEQADGSLQLPMTFPKGTIHGYFTHLYLDKMPFEASDHHGGDSQGLDIYFDNMPSIQLGVNYFVVANDVFGQVLLNLQSQANKILIKQLYVNSALLSSDIQAEWQKTANKQHSFILGVASSQDLQRLFDIFHISSNVQANQGQASFDLNWPAAPNQFNVDNLLGEAKISLQNGYVVDLGAGDSQLGFGKLLSLLSVTNLLKGLNTLKHKGYTFDRMQGDIHFDQKNIVLNDFDFDGSVADIKVSGNMIRNNHQLNFDAIVRPNVTASLPVVAGVATLNPFVGVATWIASELFGSSVSKAIESRYKITGTYEYPKVDKVNNQRNK